MAYSPETDYNLNVARGLVPSIGSLRKFGRNTDCDQNTDTDIWDGDDPIWTAPTAARQHTIVSTSSDDGGSLNGARKVKVYGLTSWSAAEVSEEVTMNGTTGVNTSNSYVIIHRMKVTDYRSTGPNVGTITATAMTDATVTAQINPGEGQTQMAVYGIPSGVNFYMVKYYASIAKGSASLATTTKLMVNPIPGTELGGFLTKHTYGMTTEGSSSIVQDFPIPNKIEGPAIIKIQTRATADNSDVSAGFDGYLVTE